MRALWDTLWPFIPLVLWLTIGVPLSKRGQRKRERFWAAQRRQWRELEIDIAVNASDGEDYLRRKLLADLKAIRAERRGRELFEQMCREQGIDPHEFDEPIPWYWPLSQLWRRKASSSSDH